MENSEDKVWVTITRKLNLGNYESAEIMAGYSKTYSKKDKPLELMEKMIDEIANVIESKIPEEGLKKKSKRKPKRRFTEASESDTY